MTQLQYANALVQVIEDTTDAIIWDNNFSVRMGRALRALANVRLLESEYEKTMIDSAYGRASRECWQS